MRVLWERLVQQSIWHLSKYFAVDRCPPINQYLMNKFKVTEKNKVKRVPSRGDYQQATIYQILDQSLVAHVGFVVNDEPFVIPMTFGRKGSRIYLHGANTSRLIKNIKGGIPVCITVTQLDGIVLARSAFHHSMNYQSAVIFGKANEIMDETEKVEALKYISEHILPGRWDSVRKPNQKELKATSVLQVEIEHASAKLRTGPPVDEKADYQLPIWAGVVPIKQVFEPPVADPKLASGIEPGSEIAGIFESQR